MLSLVSSEKLNNLPKIRKIEIINRKFLITKVTNQKEVEKENNSEILNVLESSKQEKVNLKKLHLGKTLDRKENVRNYINKQLTKEETASGTFIKKNEKNIFNNKRSSSLLILPQELLNSLNLPNKQSFVFSRDYNKHSIEKTDIDNEFKKVFQKNLNQMLNIKYYNKQTKKVINNIMGEERQLFSEKSRANNQIVAIKEKLHFMKGIVDYCFPKIMINKIKIIHNKDTPIHTENPPKKVIKSSSHDFSILNFKRNYTNIHKNNEIAKVKILAPLKVAYTLEK